MFSRHLLRNVLLTLLSLSFVLLGVAQERKTITGKVTNASTGAPIAGASVTAKGASTGTITDENGSFSITVASNVNTLVISSVGFTNQEINISGKSSITVALTEGTDDLEEVVVVGYGTAKKKDLTGSVGSVKSKDFNKGVFTAPDQLIQGKVAGVQVINNSGAPGGGTTVRIRGISSIRSGNQPLFVVDGIPLSGGSVVPGLGSALGNAASENPLNFLDPNDIESVDVLKDASATAIFGARGANGVVIINTKRGKAGSPKIEFNTSMGVSSIMKRLEVLDGNEYRAALASYGLSGGNFGDNVDALDAILQNAITNNYSVAITGGATGGNYRLSLGHINQEGIVRESGFKKYNANFSGSFKFLESKKLGLDVNVLATQTTSNNAPISNNAGFQGSLIGNALQWNPTASLAWKPIAGINAPNGVIPPFGNSFLNPLALLAGHDDVTRTTNLLASIAPSYKLSDDFEYKFLFSVNYALGERRAELRRWLNFDGNRGFAQIANNRAVNTQYTHTLAYNKDIGKDLRLNAVAGYEYLRYDYSGYGMTGNNFVDYPGIKYTDYMQNVPNADRSMYSFADPVAEIQSVFARVNLNYQGKYLLTATARRDGSNKFGINNKYGVFPSFAFAWNINEEDFMKSSGTFSNLKLRLGWGQTGNQEFPPGAPLRTVSIGQENNQSVTNLENPDVKWETNTLANIGIDFGILDNKITGSIDWYNRTTTDALFQQVVVQPGPPFRYWTNLDGEIVNSGLEFTLTAALMRKKDLTWNATMNIAFQKNELKNFVGAIETGGLHGQGISGATIQRLVSGQPINVYYMRRFLGIDKTTGQSTYEDNGNTLYYVGSPNPKQVVGFSTDVSYKKWSLIINMNGALGHYLYNNTANTVLPIGNLGTRNIAKSLLNSSVKESASNPIAPSTRYLEKGDYLKLANATISYRLGNVGKVFKNANLSLSAQNLFVITKFSGFDPEVNVDKNINGVPSLGIEYIPYPTARNIILGLNFSF